MLHLDFVTRLVLTAVTLLLGTACYGIPDDTVVDKVRVKAWGGTVGGCQELDVDLAGQRAGSGPCDGVDLTTAAPIAPETADAIRAGVDTSDFARQNVEPSPDCPTCPTRSYAVFLSSASANLETQARILPSPELLSALAPLSPP